MNTLLFPSGPLLHLSNASHSLDVPCVLVNVLVLEALQDHLQVVRQDGDQVDGVQHAVPKTLEVWSRHQAQEVLQGEEGDAERFNTLSVEPSAGLA